MNKIYRSGDVSLKEGRIIEGYAIVFESWSRDLGGYTEIIHKGAVTDEMIKRSDIIANMDHKDDYMMARSKYGTGNLQLSIDDHGVKFRFDCPETAKGEELLQHIKRGEISECSFCFTLPDNDECEIWYYDTNKNFRHEIFEIGQLYDISCLTTAAYADTSVSARNLEMARRAIEKLTDNNMNDSNTNENDLKEIEMLKQQVAELTMKIDELKADDADNEDEQRNDEEIENAEEKPAENADENAEINNETETDSDAEEDAEDEDEEIKNAQNRNIKFNMLTKQIRSAMTTADHKFTVNLEKRAVTLTGTNGVHDDVVETEIPGLLEPLYAESVLAKLGVRFYNGLPMGDVQIPKLGKNTVGWADEVAAASASNPAITSVKLSPKRLTCYVDISRALIATDTIGTEAAIKRDIVNAVADKLQSTIFGAEAGTTTKPAGIFADIDSAVVTDFAGVTEMEAAIDDANVTGNVMYLMNPHVKAHFRHTSKGTKSTELLFEDNAMDGTPAVVSSSVANNCFAVGDFSSIAVGIWGDAEIIVDEYTQAVNGCVRLIVNMYADAAVARPEGLAMAKIA